MKTHAFLFAVALLIAMAALFAWQAPVCSAERLKAATLPIKTGANVHHWWSGEFDPGKCMTEMVNGRLINSSRFAMYDRENLDKIMQEHNLSIAGEVSPETAIKIGELTGCRYLISGTVLDFIETSSGGGSNFSLGFGIGASGSAKGNKKVKVKTGIKITDTVTSRQLSGSYVEVGKEIPVASGGGSFYIAGTGGGSEGVETSASGLSKGLEEVANELVAKLEQIQIKEATVRKIEGYVMDIDGNQIYINLDNSGDMNKVAKGRRFKVTRSKSIKDPRSLQIKTINRPIGDIEVMSVDSGVITCKASSTSEPVEKNDRVVTEVVEE